jgi:hypothetical protein
LLSRNAIQISNNVDKSVKALNKLKKGDDITLRVTDALAITVVKP